jgi:hypothetical protein
MITKRITAVEFTELEALRVELLERFDRLEALLLRGRRPRDEEERALILAIAEAAPDVTFTAAAVIDRARDVPALEASLLAADIDGGRQLGKLLARLRGAVIEGLRLECVGTYRGRLLWRVTAAGVVPQNGAAR